MQPKTMTIKPAAGPLTVSSELLMKVVTIDPMIAVKMPASGGYPLASEIPKQRGKAIKNTRNPERISSLKYRRKPLAVPCGTSSIVIIISIPHAYRVFGVCSTTLYRSTEPSLT